MKKYLYFLLIFIICGCSGNINEKQSFIAFVSHDQKLLKSLNKKGSYINIISSENNKLIKRFYLDYNVIDLCWNPQRPELIVSCVEYNNRKGALFTCDIKSPAPLKICENDKAMYAKDDDNYIFNKSIFTKNGSFIEDRFYKLSISDKKELLLCALGNMHIEKFYVKNNRILFEYFTDNKKAGIGEMEIDTKKISLNWFAKSVIWYGLDVSISQNWEKLIIGGYINNKSGLYYLNINKPDELKFLTDTFSNDHDYIDEHLLLSVSWAPDNQTFCVVSQHENKLPFGTPALYSYNIDNKITSLLFYRYGQWISKTAWSPYYGE